MQAEPFRVRLFILHEHMLNVLLFGTPCLIGAFGFFLYFSLDLVP